MWIPFSFLCLCICCRFLVCSFYEDFSPWGLILHSLNVQGCFSFRYLNFHFIPVSCTCTLLTIAGFDIIFVCRLFLTCTVYLLWLVSFPIGNFLVSGCGLFFFPLPQRSSFIFDVNMVLWCWIPLLLLVCKPFDFSDKSERKLCWAHYSWLLFLGFHHLKYIMLLTSGLQNVCWKTS